MILVATKICSTSSIPSSMMNCNQDVWTLPCDEYHTINNIMNIRRCSIECLSRYSAKALQYQVMKKTCTCIPDWPGVSYNQYANRRSCMVSDNFIYICILLHMLHKIIILITWAVSCQSMGPGFDPLCQLGYVGTYVGQLF